MRPSRVSLLLWRKINKMQLNGLSKETVKDMYFHIGKKYGMQPQEYAWLTEADLKKPLLSCYTLSAAADC
jgi:hypothetical protein